VFVFAGGVSHSWKDFTKKVSKFEHSKGPDFISRLRGHLDIASINGPGNPAAEPGDESADRFHRVLLFRRAVLLRALLEVHLPDVLDKNSKEARIATEVVRAFLGVPIYLHEARSMQAILEMSRLSPRGALQKSSLPARDQLAMHVDADEFFMQMERDRFRRHLPIEQTERDAEVKRASKRPITVAASASGGKDPRLNDLMEESDAPPVLRASADSAQQPYLGEGNESKD
jgi:hypothetical protein